MNKQIAVYFHTYQGDFTSRAQETLQRAENIFVSKLTAESHLEEVVAKANTLANGFVHTGKYPPHMKEHFIGDAYIPSLFRFLRKVSRGREVSIRFEKTAIDPRIAEDKNEAQGAYFTSMNEKISKDAMLHFLEKWDYYLQNLNQRVTQQILALETSTAALLEYHRQFDVPEFLQREGATIQAVFPTENYPISHEIQMVAQYRRTGRIDDDLYARSMMEFMVEEVLKEISPPKDNQSGKFVPLANFYAQRLTAEEIYGLRGLCIINSERLYLSGPTMNRFFRQKGLPSLQESLRVKDVTKLEN